ncbi:MAG TPA: hypothetical protein VFN48_02930 [Solirubrobacteraceae bacterium]|nr:hypothetical protein [Solirubrobacteraceae bacterium]
MDAVIMAIGAAVALVTALSVLFSMVLPRRPRGFERLSLAVNSVVRLAFLGLSRLARRYEAKDALLAPMAPVALVVQLAVWAACFALGFGLLLEPTTHNLALSLLQAVAALFTVGAASAGGTQNPALDITAGASWVIVVALQIAYLPSLYAAFNKREALVALLEARAGVPAWGPELLARHQLVGIVDTLPEFYAAWEEWAADVAESHTTYPVLQLFRSPEPWYSWLIGLLAVLDGAAMHLALAPSTASSQARLCLRMGFTTLRRMATTLGWEVDPDPHPEDPITLSFAEFAEAVDMLRDVGFAMEHTAEEAWADFRGWRVNYEAVAYRLADYLTAPPAPWSGSRRHLPPEVEPPHRPPQRKPGALVDAQPPAGLDRAPAQRRSR